MWVAYLIFRGIMVTTTYLLVLGLVLQQKVGSTMQ